MMQNQWFLIKEKFSHLSIREQYIILFSGLFIIFMLFNSLYFDTTTVRKARLNKSISQIKQSSQQLEVAIAKAELSVANDPNIAVDAQIKKFEKHVDKIDNQLLSLTNELISPQKMRTALQDLLSLAPGVEITSFMTLQPQSLISASKSGKSESLQSTEQAKKSSQKAINLYRHGIKLSLKGDYFALRNYLKSIEELPWAFYWQAFDYQVTEFPQAQLNIEMYSLSTKEEFIGV